MTAQLAMAFILGVTILLSWGRLWYWHRSAQMVGQASGGRLLSLALLQPVSAALLYFALYPPGVGGSGTGALRIATAGASRLAGASVGAPLVLLPEAPDIRGGEAVPDLATALRRHPDVTTISISGDGLRPRDMDAARPLNVKFDPSPLHSGIAAITPPAAVAPGGRFTLGGTIAGLPGATVELIDPAGRVTDRGAPDKDGRFLLNGTARAAGAVTFTLRVRLNKRIVEQADVPVWVSEAVRPRMLILAGAPGPEVKYLRRRASDAGFDVTTQMKAGGGVALGDAPIALNAPSLRRFDVAIVDDRAWPGARGSLLAAVRSGMGLVLRAGGAIDGATRSQWQALGLGLSGPGGIAPIALPKVADQAVAQTRHGIGKANAPVDMALPEDMAPDVSRIGLMPGGANMVPLLHDAGGASLAAWRALGMGRVALFTPIDSYGLTLTGRGDLYDDWWNALLEAVARPAPASHMTTDIGWVGERVTLCGLTGGGLVETSGQRQAAILPVAGCGSFWPSEAGWHYLRAQGQLRPFYVQPSSALPIMRAARDRQATVMLRNNVQPTAQAEALKPYRSPWFFWLAWLAVSALLWWLERSRLGRRADAPSPLT